MVVGEKTDVFLSEDIYATTNVETAFFSIYRGNDVVYEGRCEIHPDGSRIKIYLNRYARGVLDGGELPAVGDVTVNEDGMGEFRAVFEDEDGETISTSIPCRVWYGNGVFDQAGKMFTTEVINGHASPMMRLPFSHDARYSFNMSITVA